MIYIIDQVLSLLLHFKSFKIQENGSPLQPGPQFYHVIHRTILRCRGPHNTLK